MKACVSLKDLLFKFIMLAPIAMLIQRQFDFANRLVAGAIIILLFAQFFYYLRKDTFLIITIGLGVFAISLLNIEKTYFTTNMLFYYPMWILYLMYCKQNWTEFCEQYQNNLRFTRFIIWLWCGLVLISLEIGTCYTETGLFQSFSQGPFRFAPTALFMAVIIWSYAGFSRNKNYLFLIIIPFVSMVGTGSRTYTIIMLFVVALAFYNFFENKKIFALFLIPFAIVVFLGLKDSQFVYKFVSAMGNTHVKDPLAALTSNRSVIWAGELEMFSNAGIIEKLFGAGLTGSYTKNMIISGQPIWAHNDFMELLNAHGIVGILIYVLCFIELYAMVSRYYKYTKVQALTVILVCFLNAFFNGLYVYATAMLSVPFLMIAVTMDFKKQKNADKGCI